MISYTRARSNFNIIKKAIITQKIMEFFNFIIHLPNREVDEVNVF